MTREANAVGCAAAAYLAWVAATYLLEGLPETLLRPEAVHLRLAYASFANLLLGVAVPLWLIGRWLRAGLGRAEDFGFSGAKRTAVSVATAAVFGGLVFALLRPGDVRLLEFVNAFFQVWVVSVAEIVVCWALLGGTVLIALRRWSAPGAWFVAAVVAAIAFGAYHFAHSPPFNEPRTVLFLAGIGLVTSAWRFASRELYGTAVFHNFLGVVGVLSAVKAGSLADPRAAFALGATALAAAAALALFDLVWIRRADRG